MEIQSKNYFLGLVGALIGAVIGAVVYFVVSKLGFFSFWAGGLGTMISIALYKSMSKSEDYFGVILSIILNIAAVFISEIYFIYNVLMSKGIIIEFSDMQEFLKWSAEKYGIFSTYKYIFFSAGISIFIGILGIIEVMENKKNIKSEENEEYTPQVSTLKLENKTQEEYVSTEYEEEYEEEYEGENPENSIKRGEIR